MNSGFSSQALIQLTGLIVFASLLVWALVSELLLIAPAAARHFLAANVALLAAVALTLQRASAVLSPPWPFDVLVPDLPAWASWPLANGLVIAAFAIACRGLRRLLKIRRATWGDKLMLAVSCLAMFVLPVGATSAWAYAVIFSIATAWHCAVMARDAWAGTAAALGRRVGFVLTAPLVLSAVLVASQPLRLNHATTSAITISDPATLWGLLWMALMLNICFMMLVLARLVVVLRSRAERDHLTGLFNRRRWEAFLAYEWQRSLRHPPGLCLVMLDVDHFKRINDTLGHAAGDVALKHVAAILHQACRSSDIAARVGGEEFAVILAATSLAGALEQAERLREALSASPYDYLGTPHSLTVSLGVASSQNAASIDDLSRQADMALYAAKGAGRNCVRAAELAATAAAEASSPRPQTAHQTQGRPA